MGEDVERGTFSHRHIKITDQETGEKHVPLEQFGKEDGQLMVQNTCLSELGILGYEFGYSVLTKKYLTIFEAQFGDFGNGAQTIIDQYISTSEQKWGRTSNLVMLLPHGYDGQGPEHSNARIERFLAQTDDDLFSLPADLERVEQLERKANLIICNLTSSANYFHAL